jgi:hypothetical protein
VRRATASCGDPDEKGSGDEEGDGVDREEGADGNEREQGGRERPTPDRERLGRRSQQAVRRLDVAPLTIAGRIAP